MRGDAEEGTRACWGSEGMSGDRATGVSNTKLSRPDPIAVKSRPIEFAAKPWGSFSTLEEGPGYKVKRLVVRPGGRLSLQKHRHRAEHWVVVAGTATVVRGKQRFALRRRQCAVIPRQAWHRIENRGRQTVVVIEVQHGDYLGEDDIIRKQDDYGRIEPRAESREPSLRRAQTSRAARRAPSAECREPRPRGMGPRMREAGPRGGSARGGRK